MGRGQKVYGAGKFIKIMLLGEGTFINRKFTWGGDVYKQKFYLGRGHLWGETIINKILLGEGTFIKKNVAWGGDVYEDNMLTWGRDVYKQKFYLGRGRL